MHVYVHLCVYVYRADGGSKGIPGERKRLLMPETNSASSDSVEVNNTRGGPK